jgi:hypothetical protein
MKLTIILALFAAASLLAAAQSTSTEKYPQSELQHDRLVIKQQALRLAQVDYNNAVANMNTAANEYIAESAKVKTENKWPDSVKFDLAHIQFCDKLNPADGSCVPEPAPAPAEKK